MYDEYVIYVSMYDEYNLNRDGKSVYNSTDEYLVPKNSTKTRISRHIAICAKTA